MAIDERYRDAIRDLVGTGVLSEEQATAVESALDAVPDAPPAPAVAGIPAAPARATAGWVAEVAGYLGGGLMLCGLLLVLATSWSSLDRASRIGSVAVAFALLVGAAVVIAGGRLRALTAAPPSPQRRVIGALLGIAVVPAVPLVGLSMGEVHHAWSVAFVVGLAVALAGLWLVPNLFGVLVAAAASFVAALVVTADFTAADRPAYGGIAVLVVAVAWAVAGLAGRVRPRFMALGIASVFGLIGAQLLYGFAAWPAYTTTVVIALAGLALYRIAPDPVLVVAAVISVTIAVPEAVSDWTGGGLGAAYIVLLGGTVLVAGSVAALRLRKARAVAG